MKSPPIVVYAGAAPGNHIPFLSFLFPFVTFVCVDPRPFAIYQTARIQIRQRMFDDDYARALAKENSDRPVLFISDIRSCNNDRQCCHCIALFIALSNRSMDADWKHHSAQDVEAAVWQVGTCLDEFRHDTSTCDSVDWRDSLYVPGAGTGQHI